VFDPTQIANAYSFSQVSYSTASGMVPANGAGQTIAIVDAYDDPKIASDLHHFDQTFGLPDPPSFTKVMQSGTVANAAWASEIALDVEWAHAIAPGARILLVEARSEDSSDLMNAVRYAASQPGVSVVSMSWGGGEFSSEASFDSYFTTPAGHAGVTFVASSGDAGSPTWPGISPNVLSVGGTTLQLTSNGSYGSESAWSQSGGGVSTYEPRPGYQVYASTGSLRRTTPDVAFNANPSTGLYVYDSYNGSWFSIGGTSAGAPQWAALVAIADQGRALQGKSSLDGPTQTMYALYRMSQTAEYTYYHDVVSGASNNSAGIGYDRATGLGSPIASQVISALVAWNGSGFIGSISASPQSRTASVVIRKADLSTPVAAPVEALAPAFAPATLSSNPVLAIPASPPSTTLTSNSAIEFTLIAPPRQSNIIPNNTATESSSLRQSAGDALDWLGLFAPMVDPEVQPSSGTVPGPVEGGGAAEKDGSPVGPADEGDGESSGEGSSGGEGGSE
jgi:subtilase family serine protease